MNAWAAGADGIHVFNNFNPHAAIWRELGDPDSLLTKDKLYFVHVRNGDPQTYLAGGRDHRTVPLLGPGHGKQISPEHPLHIDLTVGDDPSAAENRGKQAHFKLHLKMPSLASLDEAEVTMNGKKLTDGELSGGWADYVVPVEAIRRNPAHKGSDRVIFGGEVHFPE